MSTTNPEFPQELIESWRDAYDLNDQDIDDIQKKWQTVIKEGLPQKSFLEKSEQNFKKRNQRVQASKDEICEFVKLHYPLDEAFLKALDQKWAELADKFDHEKLGKLSDHFTDTTSIVDYRRDLLQQYEQKVRDLAQQQSFQFSPDDRASLKDLQQELDIADEIADRILRRQKYRHQVSKTIEQKGDRPTDDFLLPLRAGLGLAESDIQDIDRELLAGLSPAQPQPTVQPPTQRSGNLRPELAAQIYGEVVQELQLDQSPPPEVEVMATPSTPDPEPSIEPLVEPGTPTPKKEREKPKVGVNPTSQSPLRPPVVQPPRPCRHREPTGNQPAWLVGGVLAMLALTAGSVVAYQKMQNDRLISATLQQADGFKTEKRYDRCITHITQASSAVQSSQQAKNLLASCQDGKADQQAISQFQTQLNKAQALKDKGSYEQAIDQLQKLPALSPKTKTGRVEFVKLGDRAKTLKNECAQNLLDIAQKDYQDGKQTIPDIIRLLNRIPADTTAFAKAKTLKTNYQAAWEADQATLAALKQATAAGSWNAVAYTQTLKTAYGQQQANPLITRAKEEIAAIAAANSAASGGTGTSGTGTSGTGTSGSGTSGSGTSGSGTSGSGTSGSGTSSSGSGTSSSEDSGGDPGAGVEN